MTDVPEDGPATRPWQPANEIERLLVAAMTADDLDAFLRVLVNAPLYLPGFDTPDRVAYRDFEGVRHLVVCTSVQELYASAGELIAGWRGTTLVELVASWPDPSWGLAVDPAAPIGVYISPGQLAELPLPDQPPFRPENETERLLFEALVADDPQALLDTLVVAQVIVPTRADAEAGDPTGVPWAVADVDGVPTVSVFTSAALLGREPVPARQVDLVAVLMSWPTTARQLAVNPGTEVAARFPAERVADLVRYAAALAAREGSTASPGVDTAPDAPADDVPPGPDIAAISDILRGK